MAEWSKALESGCYGNLSSPKGRGFEPHFCQTSFFCFAGLSKAPKITVLIDVSLLCIGMEAVEARSEGYRTSPEFILGGIEEGSTATHR